MPNPNSTGQLAKLTISAFEKPDDAGPAPEDKIFEAFYNPTTFASGYTLKYSDVPIGDGTKKEMRYNGYDATTYSFELLLDGTGASIPLDSKQKLQKNLTVKQMVDKFLKIVYGYDGSTHRASYLQLKWGSMAVPKCVLVSANITYELFKADGDPLRAKIACSFKEFSYEELAKAEAKTNSPDLTHVRVVQQGDRLPLMCEKIYGDALLYLEVARHNRMTNYRNLTPGQKIYFPPLASKKS